MPIQNVGTLVENLAVTETAGLLLERLQPDQTLGFVNAFAMPTLSEWRCHKQSVGISSEALRQIARSEGGGDFVEVMRRCLRHSPDKGPSGVLLVSLLATLRGSPVRVWANDIREGHYGDAIPSLEDVADLVEEILPESTPAIRCETCSIPYPVSLDDLERTLGAWQDIGATFGFLDPMRYVLTEREGAYTHPSDHRRWLRHLRGIDAAAALHFTGNSDWPSLRDELGGLREDLQRAGFPCAMEVSRQHYVVSIGASDIAFLDELASRLEASWSDWCDRVPEIKKRRLGLRRFGS